MLLWAPYKFFFMYLLVCIMYVPIPMVSSLAVRLTGRHSCAQLWISSQLFSPWWLAGWLGLVSLCASVSSAYGIISRVWQTYRAKADSCLCPLPTRSALRPVDSTMLHLSAHRRSVIYFNGNEEMQKRAVTITIESSTNYATTLSCMNLSGCVRHATICR